MYRHDVTLSSEIAQIILILSEFDISYRCKQMYKTSIKCIQINIRIYFEDIIRSSSIAIKWKFRNAICGFSIECIPWLKCSFPSYSKITCYQSIIHIKFHLPVHSHMNPLNYPGHAFHLIKGVPVYYHLFCCWSWRAHHS